MFGQDREASNKGIILGNYRCTKTSWKFCCSPNDKACYRIDIVCYSLRTQAHGLKRNGAASRGWIKNGKLVDLGKKGAGCVMGMELERSTITIWVWA